MGFFSRRKEKESAIPASTVETGDVSAAPVGTVTPAPEPAPTPPPGSPRHSIAEEVAAVAGGDLGAQLQQLQSLMAQHSVDLRSQPMEVREAVVADLNAGGVPAKLGEGMNVTDPAQIQTIVAVLIKHGLLPAGTTVDTG
jgi:hypothetical protein